jgi:hypothetical protein
MKWLDLVQMRPGMYLGVSAPYFGALFERLEGMIVGYTLAVQAHDVPDAGVDLYSSFHSYLERGFGWNLSEGPIRTIRRESSSDSEAWDAYWRLLADFRKGAGTG